MLFTALVAYTAFLIRQSRRASGGGPVTSGSPPDTDAPQSASWLRNVALIVAGLAALVLGSTWLVAGAVTIAETLGVSELVIGLTIVAAGTSLPEVATSMLATGHRRR
ncbi:MAG: hypothetical protein WD995_08910 [Gemmatimonadota bacterium]